MMSLLKSCQLEEIERASQEHDGVPHGVVMQLLDHIRSSEKMQFQKITLHEKDFVSFVNVVNKQIGKLLEYGYKPAGIVISSDLVPVAKFLKKAENIWGLPIDWTCCSQYNYRDLPIYIDYFSGDSQIVTIVKAEYWLPGMETE